MDSTTRALQRGSKGLVIGARDGTVSEDALLSADFATSQILMNMLSKHLRRRNATCSAEDIAFRDAHCEQPTP